MSVHVNILLSNYKQNILLSNYKQNMMSLSLLAGTTVATILGSFNVTRLTIILSRVNYKGAYQTAWMGRLVCALVVTCNKIRFSHNEAHNCVHLILKLS